MTTPQPTPTAPSSDAPPFRYGASLANLLEAKWQDHWDENRTFSAPNPGEPGFDASRPKKFILDMFPYPSGAGLHVGHPLGYIATDIFARYLRMTGHNVLHAMGFDAFGLPAEQYAVQTNTHPRITTERNISTMKVQLRRLGLGHDPRRGVATTDEPFYRWTQWIFLQIYNSWYDAAMDKARPIAELVSEFESGTRKIPGHDKPWSQLTEAARSKVLDQFRLAYLAEQPVNWCPMLGTVLANEEVTADGRSERGNYPVYKRPLKQWVMRITAYADRLLADLDPLAWPEPIKLMQRNWIGKSEGAYVDFDCSTRRIRVFTTRPDTLFGATYMVLSPEHEMVDHIAPEKYGDVKFSRAIFPGSESLAGASPKELIAAYRAYAKGKTDDQRTEAKEKTGVFTGAYAVNPVNNERIPVFIADYVLTGYGTGAIMAVPAHDERDFEFARAFSLPVRDVVYSRPVAAMRYFASEAHPGGGSPAGWREQLADFIALVTSSIVENEPFDVVLAIIQGRRSQPAVPGLREIDRTEPGGLGRQRGALRAVWLEVIDQLQIADLADLCTRFKDAAFHLRSGKCFDAPGLAANSRAPGISLNDLTTDEAKKHITQYLESAGRGRRHINYKLREWLFSRQRYWGEPFPIVFDEAGLAHDLPESMLPVKLPALENFKPESSEDPDAPVRTPLGRAADWAACSLDLGDGRGERPFTRETNTMPNWAGSCWYYLRYLDPENSGALVGKDAEKYWMVSKRADGTPHIGGVDLYVGGVEHAVLHLLYARFWHKVLFDLGHVSTPEPFGRLFNQGYIQAFAFKDDRGVYVDAFNVKLSDGSLAFENQENAGPFFYEGKPVTREYGKMGKSLKNAVAPDEVCAAFGCDTLRVYEMSMGPLEASKPWNTRDIAGAHRFLQRVWRIVIDEQTGIPRITDAPLSDTATRLLHKTIAGVRKDMLALGFNTAVAKLIELNNELTKQYGAETRNPLPRAAAEPLALMLAPLAPHIAEELWARLGHKSSVAFAPFPVADERLAADDQIEIPVQIQGKLRAKITVPAGSDAKAIEAAALASEDVKKHIDGKPIKKVIVVPGKMVNLVLG